MNRVHPPDVAAFARKFRFAGGRLRRVRLKYSSGADFAVEFTLTARTAIQDLGTDPAAVTLKFRLTGVEEFRFQKRPTMKSGSVTEARLGYFQDLFFVNLDAWSLASGDVPKVHDYRASDTYVAGRELFWEEVMKDE